MFGCFYWRVPWVLVETFFHQTWNSVLLTNFYELVWVLLRQTPLKWTSSPQVCRKPSAWWTYHCSFLLEGSLWSLPMDSRMQTRLLKTASTQRDFLRIVLCAEGSTLDQSASFRPFAIWDICLWNINTDQAKSTFLYFRAIFRHIHVCNF